VVEVSSTSALLSTPTIDKVFANYSIPSQLIDRYLNIFHLIYLNHWHKLLQHLLSDLINLGKGLGGWVNLCFPALYCLKHRLGLPQPLLFYLPQPLTRFCQSLPPYSITTIDMGFLNLCALFYPKHRRGLPQPLLFYPFQPGFLNLFRPIPSQYWHRCLQRLLFHPFQPFTRFSQPLFLSHNNHWYRSLTPMLFYPTSTFGRGSFNLCFPIHLNHR
jgi:hypothetical protein